MKAQRLEEAQRIEARGSMRRLWVLKLKKGGSSEVQGLEKEVKGADGLEA